MPPVDLVEKFISQQTKTKDITDQNVQLGDSQLPYKILHELTYSRIHHFAMPNIRYKRRQLTESRPLEAVERNLMVHIP